MTPTAIDADAARATDARVIGLVGAAHFVSHIYILVLPPLFPFVRAEFGVSYTELGIAIAIFNILTGLLQTPAGFLVDRLQRARRADRRTAARCRVARGAAVVSSFYAFVADVRALRHRQRDLPPGRLRAALGPRLAAPHEPGLLDPHFRGLRRHRRGAGDACDPRGKLRMARRLSRGWRCSASLVAVRVLLFGDVMAGRDPRALKEKSGEAAPDSRTPVLDRRSCSASVLHAVSRWSAACRIYGIVALEALWGTSLSLATTAITVYLVMSAFAVLVGGYVSARTDRHDLVAVIGLALSGLALAADRVFRSRRRRC